MCNGAKNLAALTGPCGARSRREDLGEKPREGIAARAGIAVLLLLVRHDCTLFLEAHDELAAVLFAFLRFLLLLFKGVLADGSGLFFVLVLFFFFWLLFVVAVVTHVAG